MLKSAISEKKNVASAAGLSKKRGFRSEMGGHCFEPQLVALSIRMIFSAFSFQLNYFYNENKLPRAVCRKKNKIAFRKKNSLPENAMKITFLEEKMYPTICNMVLTKYAMKKTCTKQ